MHVKQAAHRIQHRLEVILDRGRKSPADGCLYAFVQP
jgi:hypothetical protein